MPNLTRDFKQTKQVVLVAFYELMMSATAAEWISVEEAAQSILSDLPVVYLRKAVQSLVEEKLLKTKRGVSGPQIFTISEHGILLVEQKLATGSLESGDAPASDRLVTLVHNGGPADLLIDQAASLRHQLRFGNDLGDLTADEAVVAENEVAHIEDQLRADQVRAGHLWPLARNTLKWIAEKAGAAAIGKAATALLIAIAALLGVSL